MNTVSCSKMLAMPLFSGLLLMAFTTHAATLSFPSPPSKYTYTASNLSVHFKNSAGQRNSLNIQQCGKQEVPANATNTNYFDIDNAETDAFGIHLLQGIDSCVGTISSGNSLLSSTDTRLVIFL